MFTRYLKTQIKGLEIILAGEEYLDNFILKCLEKNSEIRKILNPNIKNPNI